MELGEGGRLQEEVDEVREEVFSKRWPTDHLGFGSMGVTCSRANLEKKRGGTLSGCDL